MDPGRFSRLLPPPPPLLLLYLGLGASLANGGNGEILSGPRFETPCAADKATQCNVTGLWRSDLGSALRLRATGPELRGSYVTAVESSLGAAGPGREAKLLGFVGDGARPALAFSALWRGGSISSWVGQCFMLPDGRWELRTQWMLRTVARGLSDNWRSTRFGEDRFTFVHEIK
ncbi:avidin [Denticeps clupeoides]|uniref:avidin n=1 Tax=Denticeps clupeoides TaxID=299321 RepID=UPI0010A332D3|nr:avidin-related protein 1-like [Denticeps clupeoides]